MDEELKNRFSLLQEYMNYFVDALAYTTKYHMRIITDKPISFPKNYELVGHDCNIEMDHVPWDKHERKGWSKPDKQFGDVELRYLWKQFKPISFEDWQNKYVKN